MAELSPEQKQVLAWRESMQKDTVLPKAQVVVAVNHALRTHEQIAKDLEKK